MRKILFILLCFVSLNGFSQNYYISPVSGDDTKDGKSPSQAWKTLQRANTYVGFAANDSLLIKSGEKAYGSLISPRNTLNFGTYGGTARGEITGWTDISAWTNEGGGIYSFIVPRLTANVLNLFSINNVPQQVGRFPNYDSVSSTVEHGYIECDPVTPTDTTQFVIINNSYRPSKDDFLVLRTKKWRAVIVQVTNVSGATVTYKRVESLTTGGANRLEPPDNSSGFFMIRKLSYLDQFGEWFINPVTRKLSVYFGSQNPNSYTSKVSTIDSLLNLSARTFQTVSNLKFTGANTFALNSVLGKNVRVNNCVVDNSGCRGISIVSCTNAVITNDSTNWCLENGIAAYANSFDNQTVTNNYVHNTGTIIGMGSFNNPADYVGVMALGRNNILFSDNVVRTVGLDGFQWQGSNVLGEHNLVDSFCLVLQDHGAYYTFQEAQVSGVPVIYTNRVLGFNFGGNGIGNPYGTNLDALMCSGYYNDGASINILEYGSTFYNVPRSIATSNDPLNVTVRDNTGFNVGRGYPLLKGARRDSININILNNISYGFDGSGGSIVNQFQEYYTNTDVLKGNTTWQEAIARSGNIDSNYFNLATSQKFRVEVYNPNFATNYTFANWQTNTGKDIHSTVIPNHPIDSVLFIKNPSNNILPYFLNANYISATNIPYSGNIVLQPWSSLILFYVGAVQPGIKVKMKVGH